MSGSNSEKLLKSVSIYGSYRKNKTGTVFLEHPVVLVTRLGQTWLDLAEFEETWEADIYYTKTIL